MKRILAFLGVLIINAANANDQMREWTLASGERMEAEITGFDENTLIVTLQSPAGKTIKRTESDFTTIDRAWILQWLEQFEEAQELLAKIGGTVTRHTTTGAFATRKPKHPPRKHPRTRAGYLPNP